MRHRTSRRGPVVKRVSKWLWKHHRAVIKVILVLAKITALVIRIRSEFGN